MFEFIDPAFLAVIGQKLAWLAAVIAVDVILGVIASLVRGDFSWEKLPSFLAGYGMKMVGWLFMEMLILLPEELRLLAGWETGAATAAYGLILVGAFASILNHLKDFGLLPNLFERLGIRGA